MAVNTVQLAVYILLLARISLDQWTAVRYLDWFLTTPLMLFTTIIFMHYQENVENGTTPMGIIAFSKSNAGALSMIFVANMLMLVFGYLGETGVAEKYSALAIGFLFFGIAFYIMYKKYARTKKGKRLYAFMLTTWTLYGVAYVLPCIPKNVAFNVLDIVAKNFFGIFLAFVILKHR